MDGKRLKSNSAGVLIACEGVSGSGKSEGIRTINSYLRIRGYQSEVVEWNSNKRIRSMVNTLYGHKVLIPAVYSILQWIGFFIDYSTKITGLLKKDSIVIADRYIYTAVTRDAANGVGNRIGRFFQTLVREPDLLVFFDTAPEVCCQRIRKRGKALFHPGKEAGRCFVNDEGDLGYLESVFLEYLKLIDGIKAGCRVKVLTCSEEAGRIVYDIEDFIMQKYRPAGESIEEISTAGEDNKPVGKEQGVQDG